jgi:hypothetical protein
MDKGTNMNAKKRDSNNKPFKKKYKISRILNDNVSPVK